MTATIQKQYLSAIALSLVISSFTIAMFYSNRQQFLYTYLSYANGDELIDVNLTEPQTPLLTGVGVLQTPQLEENLINIVIMRNDLCYRWKLMSAEVKLCIHRKIVSLQGGYLWYQLANIVEFCGHFLRKLLDTELLDNNDDTKGFIDFVDGRNKSDCTLVTIGIGGDIQAEKQMRKRLPKCKMYGADPVNASGHLYNQVGKYYQFAISDKTALKNTSILKNPHDIYNYSTEVVQHVSLTDFLQLINVSVVDYMFLDGEGSEYEILPLIWESNLLESHNITICQLSIELHGPTNSYNLPNLKFETLMKKLLFRSSYVPLWTPTPGNHHRMFLINSQDQKCIDRFFRHWC